MRLSIIIPTRNSFSEKKSSLELTLLSLSHQNIKKDSTEVIVVDNGSTDSTKEKVNKIKITYPFSLRYINCPYPGEKSKVRNVGARNSNGEFLIFLDDDVLFPNQSTINDLVFNLKQNEFACGVERLWTYIGWDFNKIHNEVLSNEYSYSLQISELPKGINRDSGYKNLLDVSFIAHLGALSKKLFLSVGGFNEEYIGWGRHDCDLMYRLLVEKKCKFINCYECGPIIHLNHSSKNQLLELERNEKIYQKLEKKHGLTLRYSHLFGQWEHDDHEILVKK